jgi:hypothetical protein
MSKALAFFVPHHQPQKGNNPIFSTIMYSIVEMTTATSPYSKMLSFKIFDTTSEASLSFYQLFRN